MLTKHVIQLDMQHPDPIPRIHMKQGDSLSRSVEIVFFFDKKPWEIPEGAQPVIRYFTYDPDTGKLGTGIYDTLPTGQSAWQTDGNRMLFTLVPAMLARPGIVKTDIAFVVGHRTIATFDFEIYVNPAPADGTEPQTQNYYRVATLEQINEKIRQLEESQGNLDRLFANLEHEVFELKRILNGM